MNGKTFWEAANQCEWNFSFSVSDAVSLFAVFATLVIALLTYRLQRGVVYIQKRQCEIDEQKKNIAIYERNLEISDAVGNVFLAIQYLQRVRVEDLFILNKWAKVSDLIFDEYVSDFLYLIMAESQKYENSYATYHDRESSSARYRMLSISKWFEANYCVMNELFKPFEREYVNGVKIDDN